MAFNAIIEIVKDVAKITLSGELDTTTASLFKKKLEEVATQNVRRLILFMQDLENISCAGLRVLIFTKQKMGVKVEIYIVGVQDMVRNIIQHTSFHHSVAILDKYDDEYSSGGVKP
jgi:anti-anti-sigma factor